MHMVCHEAEKIDLTTILLTAALEYLIKINVTGIIQKNSVAKISTQHDVVKSVK